MKKSTIKHFVVVLGARPNFVKAASFFKAALDYKNLKLTLIHTGQHFDDNMSKVFFDEMKIPKPDVQLDIQAESSSEKMGAMISALYQEIKKINPDGVIVFGDINSTLAAGIAAMKSGTKLFHIEAGLRSHDPRMPEELNRVIVDHFSDHLFVTEEQGVENLLLEGIEKGKISLVGNIMINSYENFKDRIDKSNVLQELGLKENSYVVATIHRVENTSDKKLFKKILETLDELAGEHRIVLPLHPGTRNKINDYGFEKFLKNLHVIEPIGYFEFNKLVKESTAVVTDSGGIQEETTHMNIPCCTLRDNTERPVTVLKGTNKLFPINSLNAKDINKHINSNRNAKEIPLWDKNVGNRIIDILIEKF